MNFEFSTSELDDYAKDMLSLATSALPKESKKFLKKSATDLSKVQKKTFKSFGLGDTGVTEAEILKSIKSGKTYKYTGDLHCRAYCSHPLGHLFDAGYIHRGGFKKKAGEETWVEGYHFIEKSEKEYEPRYFESVGKFIEEIIKKV